jgi:hypothetical protein
MSPRSLKRRKLNLRKSSLLKMMVKIPTKSLKNGKKLLPRSRPKRILQVRIKDIKMQKLRRIMRREMPLWPKLTRNVLKRIENKKKSCVKLTKN